MGLALRKISRQASGTGKQTEKEDRKKKRKKVEPMGCKDTQNPGPGHAMATWAILFLIHGIFISFLSNQDPTTDRTRVKRTPITRD